MEENQLAIVNVAMAAAQAVLNAHGVPFSFISVSLADGVRLNARRDTGESMSVRDMKAITLDVCCDLWDCTSGRCYCKEYKNC